MNNGEDLLWKTGVITGPDIIVFVSVPNCVCHGNNSKSGWTNVLTASTKYDLLFV